MALTGPSKKLSFQHIKFVDEFCLCLNAAEAARKAKYSEKTAGQIGYQLLQNPLIQEAIDAKRQEVAANTGVTPEKVVQGFANGAFFDPADFYDENGYLKNIHDVPKEARMALAGLDNEELWDKDDNGKPVRTGTVRKVKFSSRHQNLDSLAKFYGLYNADGKDKESIPVTLTVHFVKSDKNGG